MALPKQAAARDLFMQGWEQCDIARVLKLSEKTVSSYATAGSWKQERTKQSIARQTSEENALTALEYQSTIIRMLADKLKSELAENPTIDQIKAALIPKGEIDALQKLFTTIKSKELEWSAIVRIIREFTTWLKDQDMRLAQEMIDFADAYISEKRQLMS